MKCLPGAAGSAVYRLPLSSTVLGDWDPHSSIWASHCWCSVCKLRVGVNCRFSQWNLGADVTVARISTVTNRMNNSADLFLSVNTYKQPYITLKIYSIVLEVCFMKVFLSTSLICTSYSGTFFTLITKCLHLHSTSRHRDLAYSFNSYIESPGLSTPQFFWPVPMFLSL